jgi:hypothetical protein
MSHTTTEAPIRAQHVWRGPELAGRQDWLRPLTPAEVEALAQAVATCDATGLDIAAITPANFPAPGLQALIGEIRAAVLRGRGFILVRGLPVDRWTTRQSAIAYLGLGCHIGEPVSQNGKGHILGHVKDIGMDYNSPVHRGYQTAARLPYHTDSADVVGLLCLKPAKAGGLSSIASSAAIHNAMLERAPELVAELSRPVYRDRRGEVPEGAEPWYRLPVFNHMPGGGLVTSYVRSTMKKAQRFPEVPRLTPALEAACDMLDAMAESADFHLDMDFRPGDIQFLNNHWILHSRTEYEDFPEPERRRHLLRLWLACADGPPLPAAFTEHVQGATAHGRPAGIQVPGVALNAPLEAE